MTASNPDGPVRTVLGEAGALTFDVSDLLDYYHGNRLPTGVQRVQIRIIEELLGADNPLAIRLCCFVEKNRADWFEVPTASFLTLCAASAADADANAPEWRALVARLWDEVLKSGPVAFAEGACLVNIGTSWWLPNYFMYVRDLKARYGITFAVLIHDVIPAILPRYCSDELVGEFFDWFVGVLAHADLVICNSEHTRRDVQALAAEFAEPFADDRIAVVPLGISPPAAAAVDRARTVSLARWQLRPQGYAMFVSTIEARKNQLGALDAWQQLIARHGAASVPRLVLVGKRGFQSDLVFARLAHADDLRDHVVVLSEVDDEELEALYQQSLFCLYPSFYEGWGLPVSEALARGKPTLIADNSSLPEAGAGVAMTVESGAPSKLLAALETMIFDQGARRGQEKAIAARYRPRLWRDVAHDMATFLGRATRHGPIAAPRHDVLATPPGYYPIRRNRAVRAEDVRGSGEIFRRKGWWRLEDFGSWTVARGGTLSLRLRGPQATVAFQVFGLAQGDCHFTIAGGGQEVTGVLRQEAQKWIILKVAVTDIEDVAFVITATGFARLVDPESGFTREAGVGVGGVFVLDPDRPHSHTDFVEAVALGYLEDCGPTPAAMIALNRNWLAQREPVPRDRGDAR